MAVYKVQRPTQINSSWTVEKFVKMIRSLLDELDNAKINDQEIRYYTNVAISSVVHASTEGVDAGYYGTLIQGKIDTIFPLLTIDFNTPLILGNYDLAPQPDSIGGLQYTPAKEKNPYLVPMDSTVAYTDTITSPNLFNETVNPIPNTPLLDRRAYEEYFIASAITEDVLDVMAVQLPSTTVALTKMSMSELNYIKARPYSFSHSGAWTYFGGKVYMVLGREVIAGVTQNSLVDYSLLDFHISIFRKPILDNLINAWDPKSGWWFSLDVSDKHIRMLTLAVQKMCLDKLGKRFSPDHEQILNQLFGGLSQQSQTNTMSMQSDRMKQEQGFQTR